jgi:cardiolipin synthase
VSDAPVGLEPTTDRVLTVPNLISLLRLALVPVFFVLLLLDETWADMTALVILFISGFTDWLDGYLARKWNQITRLGQLLDPIADRLYIAATIIAFAIREIIPWWLVAILVGRDLIMAVLIALLRRKGYGPPEVHFLGKVATFDLLYAFPLLLIGEAFEGWVGTLGLITGWAFAIWGTGLYVWSGILYATQIVRVLGSPAPAPAKSP